ncbi:succinate-semialdehyde dehydrogenase [Taibaiella sp. KBW10]|uniref:NAD-dependent succinate-semialdehyde dehydrogenase n=1 Tax=Taibaiella sp. KBW10 TaxID=2153357 RepID=UPI000F59A8B3|nr:NAD-dependent succinate-semialdehyde dehydrogenase [Taibaiella sp. KBW10]RQO29799.1 succinate-semialdehyde dehydrogenase [Taibaiella sp. KBW10]
MITSINPYTGKSIRKYKEDTPKIIAQKLERAHEARAAWSALPLSKRAGYLKKLAQYILKHKDTLGGIATAEMGKPITQSIIELEKCAFTLNYYADQAATFLSPELVQTEASDSFVHFEPLGTVLAIMPWNFPYWQVFRAMGPILISGNTMLLKHASNVMGCANGIKEALDQCGFPEGVFDNLQITSGNTEMVIADPRVDAITFTGSTAAGKKVAAVAAQHLKKQVLELGGSDAYIILKDADLALAVKACATSRLNNTGQSCIAAKRMIVDKSIAAKFEKLLVAAMEARTFADPALPTTTIGSMARADLRDELHDQVNRSIEKGATLLCGGYIPEGKAACYPPTVLTGVKKGMPAYEEELFGPVATVIIAENEEDAIRIANDTIYGLGGAIFSKNVKKATQLATYAIHSGSVFVNDYVRSDARLPFGGIKQSGYGRELSYYGMREFVNIKTIYVK